MSTQRPDGSINPKLSPSEIESITGVSRDEIRKSIDESIDTFKIKLGFLLANFPGNIISTVLEYKPVCFEEQMLSWFLLHNGDFGNLDQGIQEKLGKLQQIITSSDIDNFHRLTLGSINQDKNGGITYSHNDTFISFSSEEFQILRTFWKENNGETYSGRERLSDSSLDILKETRRKISDWWAHLNGL